MAAKCFGLVALFLRYAHARYGSQIIDRFLYWGDHRNQKSGEIKGSCQPPLDGTLCAFSLFRDSEINLHWLESPELGTQNDTMYVGCDVIWYQMTSFDRHLGYAILDFIFFLKSQKVTEIDTKSSQNAYYMYKLVNFWNAMKKTGKKPTELCQKSWFSGKPIWN